MHSDRNSQAMWLQNNSKLCLHARLSKERHSRFNELLPAPPRRWRQDHMVRLIALSLQAEKDATIIKKKEYVEFLQVEREMHWEPTTKTKN